MFTVLIFEVLESPQAIEANVVLTVFIAVFVDVAFDTAFDSELYSPLRCIISMYAHDTMC